MHTENTERTVTRPWLQSNPRLGGVILLAAGLRFYGLKAESLWFDELFSVAVANTFTTSEILFQLPFSESHPPLYFALLRQWTLLVGSSEFAVRSLSVLFSVGTIALMYVVAREIFDTDVAILTALVLALSPFHIEFAQEARMYSLFTLLTLASYYALLKLRDGRDGMYGYLLSTILLAYTHVFGLLVILAQNLYLFISYIFPTSNTPSINLKRWIVIQAIVAICSSPWLAVLLYRIAGVSQTTQSPISWISQPGILSLLSTPVRYVTRLRYFMGDQRSPLFLLVVLLLLVVAVLVALALFQILLTRADRPDDRRYFLFENPIEFFLHNPNVDKTLLLLVWLAIPVLVPFVLSYLITPVFVHRYTIAASLPFYILIGKGVQAVRRDYLRYLLLGVLIAGLAAPLPTYYASSQQEQWREATHHIESNADDDDLVVHASSMSRIKTIAMLETDMFAYYSTEQLRTKTVPIGAEASQLRRITGNYDRAWILVSHTPNEKQKRFVDRLSKRHTVCGQRSFFGIDVYCFK